MKNTIKYCSVTNSQAKLFLLDSHAEKEQIYISDAMFWVAACIEENIVGVVGLNLTKNTARIKALYVNDKNRKKKIAKGLLNYLINVCETTNSAIKSKNKITVFATEKSKNIFEEMRFKTVRINKKNNVSYMERIKDDESSL